MRVTRFLAAAALGLMSAPWPRRHNVPIRTSARPLQALQPDLPIDSIAQRARAGALPRCSWMGGLGCSYASADAQFVA